MGCMTMEEKVAGVKAHAAANYEKGWDVFVECHSVEEPEIAKIIRQKHSVVGAVKGIAKHLGLEMLLEVREEHDAEARAGGALTTEEAVEELVRNGGVELGAFSSDAMSEEAARDREVLTSEELKGLVVEALANGGATSNSEEVSKMLAEVREEQGAEVAAEVAEEVVTESKKSRKGKKRKHREMTEEGAACYGDAQS